MKPGPEQPSEIRFGRGMDESAHEEAAVSRLRMLNARFTHDGGVQRREGFRRAATTDADNQPVAMLSTGIGLGVCSKRRFATYKPNVGLLFNKTATGATQHNWHANVKRIATLTGLVSSSTVFASPTFVDGAVVTVAGGTFALLVTYASALPFRYTVVNVDTGLVVWTGMGEANCVAPRAAAHGSKLFVYYVVGTTVRRLTIDPASASEPSAATIITDAALTAGTHWDFDAHSDPILDRAVLCYTAGANVTVARVNTAGSVTATHTDAHAGGTPRLGITEAADGSVHVIEGKSTAATYRVWRYASDLSSRTHTSTPSGQTNRIHDRVGIAASPDGTTVVAMVYSPTGNYLQWSVLSTSHGTVDDTTERIGFVPLSKPFVDEYSTGAQRPTPFPVYGAVFGQTQDTATTFGQTTAFVGRMPRKDDSDLVHASIEPMAMLINLGGNDIPTSATTDAMRGLPNVYGSFAVSSNDDVTLDWYFPQLRLVESHGTSAVFGEDQNAIFGGVMLRMDHAMADPLPRVRAGGMAYQGGALLRRFDGQEWGEVAPLIRPPAPTLANHGSGTLDAGTYAYCQVLEYHDPVGTVRRSAPSASASITVGANHDIDVTGSIRLPTMLSNDVFPGKWLLKTYRTETLGSLFYLVAVQSVSAYSAPTFTDNDEDAEIIDNQLLYTTGGVLESQPPPPASGLTVHRNRLWGVDASDPRALFFSNELVEGFAPSFNATFRVRVEAASSDILAIASLGDKLVIFTRDQTFVTYGDGPTTLGAGAFAVPEKVADIGCSGPQAVCETPLGVLFHSTDGMRVIGPDLSVNDVSGPVRDTLAGTRVPMRMAHMPTTKQVWVLFGGATRTASTEDDEWVVFDYGQGGGRWSRWQHGCLNPILDADEFAFALSGGTPARVPGALFTDVADDVTELHALEASSFKDDQMVTGSLAVPFELTIERWRAGDLLDDVRVRRVHLLASGETASIIRMVVSNQRQPKSFGTAATETYEWAGTLFNDADDYGHVQTRLKYQRVNTFDLEFSFQGSGADDDRGPVFLAAVVDFSPYSRAARRGKAEAPTGP